MSRYNDSFREWKDLVKGLYPKGTRYTVDNISSTVYINDFVVLYDGTITEEIGGGEQLRLLNHYGLL
jgi:hypothetical protein